MKKKLLSVLGVTLFASVLFAQQTYVNVEEDIMMGEFTKHDGEITQDADNPSPDEINDHQKCVRYERSDNEFDNLKFKVERPMTDVSAYTANQEDAPRMTMMVYTDAEPGTDIEIQLSTSEIDEFPQGVHSVYRATTTTQNQWEEVTFEYAYNPEESEADATNLDEVIIMFNPGSTQENTYYFDEFKGPDVLPVGASAN